ncbi:hypothetical protein D3C73_1487780 [compost metagenome]
MISGFEEDAESNASVCRPTNSECTGANQLNRAVIVVQQVDDVVSAWRVLEDAKGNWWRQSVSGRGEYANDHISASSHHNISGSRSGHASRKNR